MPWSGTPCFATRTSAPPSHAPKKLNPQDQFLKDPIQDLISSFTSRTANLPTGMALQLLCGIPGMPVLMPRQNEILKVFPVTAKPRMSVKKTIGRIEHDSRGVTHHLGASVANVDPGTP